MNAKILFSLLCLLGVLHLKSQISGTVFSDYDGSGSRTTVNPSEPTVSGIYISAYNSAGVIIASYSSTGNSSPNYFIPASGVPYNGTLGSNTGFVPAGTAVRLEFSNIPSGANQGSIGSENTSTIQFATAPSTSSDYSIIIPDNYCQSNPPIVVSCYELGNAVYGATGNTDKGVVSLPYNSSGAFGGNVDPVAAIYEVGTVWGMAYQRSTKRIFNAAVLKTGYGFGPLGPGGVYVYDFSSGTGSVVSSFNLEGVVPANGGPAITLGTVDRTTPTPAGDYILPNNTLENRDIDAFGKAGKMSFGDAEISLEGNDNTLWLVNLYQQAIISVDISNPSNYLSSVKQYPIASFSGLPSCTNGVLRPWAIRIHNGVGYLGCVCSAENSGVAADLTAYILSFDPNNPTAFTTVFSFPLNYTREKAAEFTAYGINQPGNWFPWVSSWATAGITVTNQESSHAQPVLSGIEFAEDGSMVIALLDRYGLQTGYKTYVPLSGSTAINTGDGAGDILKICKVGNSWVMEGGTGCTEFDNTTANSALNNDGPSGTGEFFYKDNFDDTSDAPTYNHNETHVGSIKILKGYNEVVATHYDPFDGAAINGYAYDLGFLWHDLSNGSKSDAFRLVNSGPALAKGVGLGDFVLVCNDPPIEIGNRLWIDTDKDGVQDAGESGLAGASVILKQGGNTLLTTTTAADGSYVFGKSITTQTLTNSINQKVTSDSQDGRQNGTDVTTFVSSLSFNSRTIGVRFPYIAIPSNATVTSATLRFTAYSGENDTKSINNVSIRGHKVLNSPAWLTGTTTSDMSNRYSSAGTTSTVTWTNPATWAADETGPDQTTPDLSSIITELITQPGWGQGNAITLILNAPANTTGAAAYDYTGGSANAVVLDINYTYPDTTVTQVVQPNTNYTICVPLNQTVITTPGYTLTTANSTTNGGTDLIDSDGILNGNIAEANVLSTDIPISGNNNHSYDFGFVTNTTCDITSITANPGPCNATNNQYTLNGQVAFTDAPSSGTLTISVSGGGSSVISFPFTSPIMYSIPGQASDGASHIVTAVFSDDPTCTGTASFTAPLNCNATCCVGANLFSNPSIENGTFDVNSSVVDPNNADFTAVYATDITDWERNEETYWINDPTRATDGDRFIYLPSPNLCFTKLFDLNTEVSTCKQYKICFDVAAFDKDNPNGGSLTSGIIIEGKYWSNTFGQGEDVFTITDFTEVTTNNPLTNPMTITPWNNLGWKRVTATITLPQATIANASWFKLYFSTPLNTVLASDGKGILLDNVCITEVPNAVTFSLSQIAPTCTNNNADNNGKITLNSVTNSDKYGYSIGATYSGTPDYANATPVPLGLPFDIITSIPNTGGTYTIRFFNGSDGCYKDTSITINQVICSSGACSSTITANLGTCNSTTNQYTLSGIVTFTNPPTTGNLTVSVGAIQQTFNAPFTSPQSYTLNGLTADGVSHTVTAVFSDDPSCTASVSFLAPINCLLVCAVTESHSSPVCNSNGTGNISTDDWFSFNLTGTVVDGSGNYVVKIGTWTSPPITSGQSVSIVGNGLGGNPSLPANSSNILIRVEDAVTNTCFTTFTVSSASCSGCPTPNCGTITVQKI